MTQSNIKISNLMLERFILRETSETETADIEQTIKSDQAVSQRVRLLKLSNQQFSEKYNKSEIYKSVKNLAQKKCSQKNINRHRYTFIHKAAYALSILLIVTVFIPFELTDTENEMFEQETDNGIRLKGITPEIHIYQKKDDGVLRLFDYSKVGENDQLQIRYQRSNYRYGAMFSIDGNHQVTLLFPDNSNASTELSADSIADFPFSYQLDGAPEFERFFMLMSHNPIDIRTVLTKAENLSLDLDTAKSSQTPIIDGVFQTSVLLSKVNK